MPIQQLITATTQDLLLIQHQLHTLRYLSNSPGVVTLANHFDEMNMDMVNERIRRRYLDEIWDNAEKGTIEAARKVATWLPLSPTSPVISRKLDGETVEIQEDIVDDTVDDTVRTTTAPPGPPNPPVQAEQPVVLLASSSKSQTISSWSQILVRSGAKTKPKSQSQLPSRSPKVEKPKARQSVISRLNGPSLESKNTFQAKSQLPAATTALIPRKYNIRIHTHKFPQYRSGAFAIICMLYEMSEDGMGIVDYTKEEIYDNAAKFTQSGTFTAHDWDQMDKLLQRKWVGQKTGLFEDGQLWLYSLLPEFKETAKRQILKAHRNGLTKFNANNLFGLEVEKADGDVTWR